MILLLIRRWRLRLLMSLVRVLTSLMRAMLLIITRLNLPRFITRRLVVWVAMVSLVDVCRRGTS